jgi:hypothetical protein
VHGLIFLNVFTSFSAGFSVEATQAVLP